MMRAPTDRRALRRLYRRNRTALAGSVGLYATGVVAAAVVVGATDLARLGALTPGDAAVPSTDPTTATLLANNLLGLGFLLAGTVTLGTTTAANLLLNGFVHGTALVALGPSPFEVAVVFVPHAVLELPGLWLAGAAGLRVPHEFARYLRGTTATFPGRRTVADVVVLALASVVLVVVAAVVETTVTTWLAEQFVM